MIKNVTLICLISSSMITHAMSNPRNVQTPTHLLEALKKGQELLPSTVKPCSYHNEVALDYEGKICFVPDPEPRLYADELLHLQDETPLDSTLANLLIKECFEHTACYKYTLDNDPFGLHETHKTFTYNTDSQTSLLLAKAAATKLGRPYKIIPASMLHRIELEKLLREIYTRKQPCTVILYELNNEECMPFVKACLERDREDYPIHLLIISRNSLQIAWEEQTKNPSCSGRLQLLQYYLGKLPVQADQNCCKAYLASVAERTNGFSASRLESLVNDVLLCALGSSDQEGGQAFLTQQHFETVLKQDYGISWLQAMRATITSCFLEAKK